MWSYNKHQIEGAEWALTTIRNHGLAYLSWQERTRKSGTALLTVENSSCKSCLIITKKRAIPGWGEHLKNLPLTKKYKVINYESLHKVVGTYDFIVLDESHAKVSSTGRPSKTWKTVKKYCKGKPILFLSATPYAEHVGLLYHQLKLSDWSPLNQKNFYVFFRKYGISNMTRTPYGLQETYTKYETEEVLTKVEHIFNFKTRADVGIEHEPIVNLIVIKPSDTTLQLAEEWKQNRFITIKGNDILGDSDMRVRMIHFQLESGTIKVNTDTSISIGNLEKINYIKTNYDLNNVVIMAHFIEERELLKAHFPGVPILSSNAHAEGVDLSMYEKLIITSMDFSTSKFTQRIARQANHERQTPIEVDVLLMDKPFIGVSVFNSVYKKKESFVKASYERAVR